MDCYFILMVVTIIGIFMAILLILICIIGRSAKDTNLSGCFCPWTFSLNIGLNMLPSDSFLSCLDSLPGHSIMFQALQLIVLAVFGAVDEPLAPCMLVHFLEI